ncbi:MAG TPA: hypothetical protein VN719_02885 [Gemmatimonadales bacterium]|nr:hypothetical protein [Gemmatimonadales bacterium]
MASLSAAAPPPPLSQPVPAYVPANDVANRFTATPEGKLLLYRHYLDALEHQPELPFLDFAEAFVSGTSAAARAIAAWSGRVPALELGLGIGYYIDARREDPRISLADALQAIFEPDGPEAAAATDPLPESAAPPSAAAPTRHTIKLTKKEVTKIAEYLGTQGLYPGDVQPGFPLFHRKLEIGRYTVILQVVNDTGGPWVDAYARIGADTENVVLAQTIKETYLGLYHFELDGVEHTIEVVPPAR